MLTKVRNILPTLWRHIYIPKIPWVPALSADQQTRLTWARVIESNADVPNVYKDFFDSIHADGRGFPYTVFTPSREGFVHKTTEKLICRLDREIYILERSGDTFEEQCYPVEGISCVEVKSILLDAHIKISGMTKRGVPASSTIKFNSTTDYVFRPILETIRFAVVDPANATQSSESGEFDHLIRLNFKFMNYARRSVLAGEKVVHFILQPEIRVPMLRVLGRTFHRIISPTHMCILTDRELIIIREDEPQNRAVDRYGGIWNYMPLKKIISLTLGKKDNSLLVLSIVLPAGVRFEYLFHPSEKHELDLLLKQFNELTARR
jgi:hypothetical protein